MASSWSTQTATAHWQGEKILSFAVCFACSRMEMGRSLWLVGVAGTRHTPSARSTASCSQINSRPHKQAVAGRTSPRLDSVWLLC